MKTCDCLCKEATRTWTLPPYLFPQLYDRATRVARFPPLVKGRSYTLLIETSARRGDSKEYLRNVILPWWRSYKVVLPKHSLQRLHNVSLQKYPLREPRQDASRQGFPWKRKNDACCRCLPNGAKFESVLLSIWDNLRLKNGSVSIVDLVCVS